jgi:MYXO-CTERM domain-containing protein
MRGRVRLLTAACLLTLAASSGGTAHAYVRSVSDAGYPLKWSSSCETVTIYLNGFSAMTPDEVAKSIGAAAAAWGPDSVTCPADVGGGGNGHPYFEILPQLATGGSVPALPPHLDGQNSIVFQTTTWDATVSPEALAFTTVSKEPSGHIVEADIEINAAPGMGFEWANLDPGAPSGGHLPAFDLQTVMTHEFGHFLGLAHTCVSDGYSGGSDDGNTVPAGTKDDKGQMIPSCADTGVPQLATVMWATIDDGSSAKRVLSTDDARGVCAIYPSVQDPHACTQNLPDDGCGCATGGSPADQLLAIGVAGLALVTGRRRPTRRN